MGLSLGEHLLLPKRFFIFQGRDFPAPPFGDPKSLAAPLSVN
jgi:hypothetical protein